MNAVIELLTKESCPVTLQTLERALGPLSVSGLDALEAEGLIASSPKSAPHRQRIYRATRLAFERCFARVSA